MNFILGHIKKFLVVLILFAISKEICATHYINKTNVQIKVTNVSAQKRREGKGGWRISSWSMFKKHNVPESDIDDMTLIPYFIVLEKDEQGDLENKQGDEIAITSPGINDKRRLFPTNNSFNYVITMNEYNSKFEKFDINHAD